MLISISKIEESEMPQRLLLRNQSCFIELFAMVLAIVKSLLRRDRGIKRHL